MSIRRLESRRRALAAMAALGLRTVRLDEAG